MQQKEYSIKLGEKTLYLRFLNWAERANSSVIARYGDTVILTTATMSSKENKNLGYFPLMVEYRENYYASGKIGGGRFHKREGRPADGAVLNGRLVDRAIRPLFNQAMRRDVQIVNNILSYDPESDPDIVALIASSVVLCVSNIPWNGPVGAIRVGRNGKNWIINPSSEEQEKSDLNIVVTGPKGKINMIEVDSLEASEKDVISALKEGSVYVEKIIELQEKILKEIGKEKDTVEFHEVSDEIKKEVKKLASEPLKNLFSTNKDEGDSGINSIHSEVLAVLEKKYEEKPELISEAKDFLEKLTDELVHESAIKNNRRVDGRKMDEVRLISGQVSVLPPRTHGSGLFMRGLTHGLSITTLDSPRESELSDNMEGENKKRFMLHYNFPPFSVGETGFYRGPGRREIGHGALAEKSILPVIPSSETFPYTIRIVTEILSSNGSTSMASVCSASLALMDAGVPIKNHVAGIAMGLMSSSSDSEQTSEKNYKILTDIQGPEDHYGDMDCKVAGTKNGINAMQMDVKVSGITIDILEKVLEQGKKARMQILEVLDKTIAQPRKELSAYAPIIRNIKIDPEKIGALIGSGGRTIKEIMANTNTQIDVEDDGSVFVTGKNVDDAENALKTIDNITREIEVGEIFDSKVVRIADFGAFVELVPGKDALVHVSELSNSFVKDVKSIVKLGDTLKVKIIKVDNFGKISATARLDGEKKRQN